eukprot:NODE_4095_length_843_cov_3.408060_g3389_i0.p1 GENE.NODE_4095_length_843_cov_3.408060_g3389_i0~~NODE_4095_length_843_cov_3.408060_g3389_i0.p1  ORF type:complete len:76 (+),score=1.25 NODE_4095_length_843_cov_3.408060_g3389_i0:399-626(+)
MVFGPPGHDCVVASDRDLRVHEICAISREITQTSQKSAKIAFCDFCRFLRGLRDLAISDQERCTGASLLIRGDLV